MRLARGAQRDGKAQLNLTVHTEIKRLVERLAREHGWSQTRVVVTAVRKLSEDFQEARP
jgi:hypothetical protein